MLKTILFFLLIDLYSVSAVAQYNSNGGINGNVIDENALYNPIYSKHKIRSVIIIKPNFSVLDVITGRVEILSYNTKGYLKHYLTKAHPLIIDKQGNYQLKSIESNMKYIYSQYKSIQFTYNKDNRPSKIGLDGFFIGGGHIFKYFDTKYNHKVTQVEYPSINLYYDLNGQIEKTTFIAFITAVIKEDGEWKVERKFNKDSIPVYFFKNNFVLNIEDPVRQVYPKSKLQNTFEAKYKSDKNIWLQIDSSNIITNDTEGFKAFLTSYYFNYYHYFVYKERSLKFEARITTEKGKEQAELVEYLYEDNKLSFKNYYKFKKIDSNLPKEPLKDNELIIIDGNSYLYEELTSYQVFIYDSDKTDLLKCVYSFKKNVKPITKKKKAKPLPLFIKDDSFLIKYYYIN